ncbi:THAP domain-containing protein 1 isoform X1 [Megachile rotundata]|uniref:THAP domain-containing protein 1 isoform X1 n=1 Tax=Megachile rotundata TaxID=143995 RepID=UPI000258D533|nr:PREDICTED: THAP domain-containing protein 1-like isoform X1 [Megachile rotundata]
MVQCFVPGCRNRSDTQNWKRNTHRSNNVKVSFHRFPKDPSIWLQILGITSLLVSERSRICSVHFEEKCFDRKGCYPQLRPNALPSKTIITEKLSNPINENELPIDDINPAELSPDTVQSMVLQKEAVTPLDDISNSLDKSLLSPQPLISKVDKGTMVSPLLIYNSPEKIRLRERIKFVESESRKKVRALQQQLRRKSDQILKLRHILNTLKDKKLLNKHQVEMIQTLGGSNDDSVSNDD